MEQDTLMSEGNLTTTISSAFSVGQKVRVYEGNAIIKMIKLRQSKVSEYSFLYLVQLSDFTRKWLREADILPCEDDL